MKNRNIRPTYTILWDLNEVLLYRTTVRDWITTLYRFEKKYDVLCTLNLSTTRLILLYILNKLHITKTEITSEELTVSAQHAGNNSLIELIHQLSCTYKPSLKMVHLVKQLHNLGHKQHICSNIGKTLFHTLRQKFPTLMRHFEHAHVVHAKHGSATIKKPNPQFFIVYLQNTNIDPSSIIFVDDQQKNIDAARSVGMNGIRFVNAEQLCIDLQKYIDTL